MPYILEGKPISPDRAFTHNGIQYPAGWLRRVSEESRTAIGVEWQPDPPAYDQRFWWGYTEGGELIPKDLDQLKEQWISAVKQTAGSLLASTDWMVTRAQDPSSLREVPADVLAARTLIREKSNEKEQAIQAAASVEELAGYLTGTQFNSWSEETPEVVAIPLDDSISFASGSTSSGITSDFGSDTVSFTL
jgi:hypothetical protein